MFTDTYRESSEHAQCDDQSTVLPSKQDENTKLAGKIAQKLMVDIAPSYVYFWVTLLEDPDLEYNDMQKKLLENSLVMIDQKRIEKANELLKKLNQSLGGQSYVALYNLAITEEALGNVEEALKLLQMAENTAMNLGEINEEISTAITRTKKNLAELEKANKQLQK